MKNTASNSQDSEQPLLCRSLVAAPDTASDMLMFMPGGLHSITPSQSGKAVAVQVLVDEQSAAALEEQRRAIVARTGKRPYFDFNHGDGPASFWPTGFLWQNGSTPGVYARGKWSKSGREGIEGHDWRQFSPIFCVDDIQAKPARIVCNPNAKPNMGGLVNDPAFHDIAPLWAKEEAAALVSKEKYDALREEMIALLAKNKAQQEALMARQAFEIKAAIEAAVARGAIAAKDFKTQESFIAAATADPAFIDSIKALKGNMALGPSITRDATAAAIRAKEERTGTYRVV